MSGPFERLALAHATAAHLGLLNLPVRRWANHSKYERIF